MSLLAHQAISSALSGNWEEAVKLNKKIVRLDKKDVDALNRLARAYVELGKVNIARITVKKVLKIDPYNPIAKRSLRKWGKLKDGKTIRSGAASGNLFLEESGKTAIVSLIRLGPEKTLSQIDSGDELHFNPMGHRVGVITESGLCVGRLPDDLSARLKKMIKHGNKYRVLVKSADEASVKVFIRETKKVKSLKGIQSFPTEKIQYTSFIPPELIHDKPAIQGAEED